MVYFFGKLKSSEGSANTMIYFPFAIEYSGSRIDFEEYSSREEEMDSYLEDEKHSERGL